LGLLLAAVIHCNGAELVNGVWTNRARHHHILVEIPHGAANITT
jgi:hypothetical protein